MRTGRRATDAQVRELRKQLRGGAPLRTAALKAGMDRKTARKYRDLERLPSFMQNLVSVRQLADASKARPLTARRLLLWCRVQARA